MRQDAHEVEESLIVGDDAVADAGGGGGQEDVGGGSGRQDADVLAIAQLWRHVRL